jgi:hypothetical protein
MVASSDNATYPNSAKWWVDNGDGTRGFSSFKACVTQDGFGFNSSRRTAAPCVAGTYNARDTYRDCRQCPTGMTTSGVGAGKTIADCGLAAGYGFYNGAVTKCPLGECVEGLHLLTHCCCKHPQANSHVRPISCFASRVCAAAVILMTRVRPYPCCCSHRWLSNAASVTHGCLCCCRPPFILNLLTMLSIVKSKVGWRTDSLIPSLTVCAPPSTHAGTYNDQPYTASTTQPCQACPTYTTTTASGATAAADCNLCFAGWGGTGCSTQCGGTGQPNYGPAGRPVGSACTACGTSGAGYSFVAP